MQLYSFSCFGNTQKEHLDALVYVPHASCSFDFIDIARETSKDALKKISSENLQKFIEFEADVGTFEVGDFLKKYWTNDSFSVGLFVVDIPRGFCDLNRPIDKAIPHIFDRQIWEWYYRKIASALAGILEKTDFVLHLHSMNNFGSVRPSTLGGDVSDEWFRAHVSEVYSGDARECTILTEDPDGKYLTNPLFDTFLKQNFAKNNIILEENTAYKLLRNYPCTDIIEQIPSSFLEITKGSLAHNNQKDAIFVRNQDLDSEKLKNFGKILSETLLQYLLWKK